MAAHCRSGGRSLATGVCFLLRCGGERRTVLLHMHRRRFRCHLLAARIRAGVTAVAEVYALLALALTVPGAPDTSTAPGAGPRAPADIDPACIVFFPDEGRLEI